MNDLNDKDLDKTLNRLMIGGAALTSALIIAGAYDAGYQAGARENKAPIIDFMLDPIYDAIIFEDDLNDEDRS